MKWFRLNAIFSYLLYHRYCYSVNHAQENLSRLYAKTATFLRPKILQGQVERLTNFNCQFNNAITDTIYIYIFISIYTQLKIVTTNVCTKSHSKHVPTVNVVSAVRSQSNKSVHVNPPPRTRYSCWSWIYCPQRFVRCSFQVIPEWLSD